MGSGGIPGCRRDEDYSPQFQALDDTTAFEKHPVTGFDFRDAGIGRYRLLMRPRRDQNGVWLLCERFLPDGSSCGGDRFVESWKQGQWYQWQVEIHRQSKSDSCGVKVGPLTQAGAPRLGR